jgi:hypothetical protein
VRLPSRPDQRLTFVAAGPFAHTLVQFLPLATLLLSIRSMLKSRTGDAYLSTFSVFNYKVIALKSRTIVVKSRTAFATPVAI